MFTETKEPTTRTIKAGDPNYMISDGLTLAQRAGIEIDPACPSAYKSIIIQAYNNGWLKPFSVVTAEEYTWMTLRRK
jgi:hypothetical protein